MKVTSLLVADAKSINEVLSRTEFATIQRLSKVLGFSETHATYPTSRKRIKDIVRAGLLPIGSCSKGFYLIKTGHQMQTFLNSLSKRANRIHRTIDDTYNACITTGVIS